MKQNGGLVSFRTKRTTRPKVHRTWTILSMDVGPQTRDISGQFTGRSG